MEAADTSVMAAQVLNVGAGTTVEAVPTTPPDESPASVVGIVVGDTLEMLHWKLVTATIQAKPGLSLIKVAKMLGIGVRTLGMWRKNWKTVPPIPSENKPPTLNTPAVEIRIGDTMKNAEAVLIRKTIEANPGETFRNLAKVLGMGVRTLGVKRTAMGMPMYKKAAAVA